MLFFLGAMLNIRNWGWVVAGLWMAPLLVRLHYACLVLLFSFHPYELNNAKAQFVQPISISDFAVAPSFASPCSAHDVLISTDGCSALPLVWDLSTMVLLRFDVCDNLQKMGIGQFCTLLASSCLWATLRTALVGMSIRCIVRVYDFPTISTCGRCLVLFCLVHLRPVDVMWIASPLRIVMYPLLPALRTRVSHSLVN